MNIKNKLYISAIISVIVVVILFSLVLVSSDRIARVNKQHELADDVHRAVSELDLVTYDYLLHREKRMEQQWNSRYDSMGEILEKAEEIEEVEMMKSIRADYAALGDLFSQVTANYEKRQKLIQEGASQEEIDVNILLEERWVAQLLIKSQAIITDASRLAEEAHAEAREARELSNTLTIALMIILAVTITTTSLVVARSISKPLDELTKGAEIIGKGNLGHLIESKTKDEVGELATAFNRMTTNLKEITASRDELNKEVAERKQAEEALRELNEELEERVDARTKELTKANEELEQEITEHKRAEERIEHLNSVLKAIRNVNQLIIVEKDRDSLLQKACGVLIEARGYDAAWLGFLSDGETFATVKGSGFREDLSRFREHLLGGEHPPCIKNALAQKEKLVLVDKSLQCGDCFFKNAHTDKEVAIIRIEHAGRLFGLLTVSFAPDVAVDREEKGLLEEVASDIAFALHDMEMEEERRRTEEALRESEERFSLFMDYFPACAFIKDHETRTLFVNKYMNDIFGAKEWLGKTVFELFPSDVAEKMMADDRITLDSGYRTSVEEVPDKNGVIHIYDTYKFKLDRQNMPPLLGGIALDITERKKAEDDLKHLTHLLQEHVEKLEESKKKEAEAYRLREHFLKETSHRIITPAAIIGGHTELLLESSNLDDDQKEKIRIIRERNMEVEKLVRDALAGKYLKEEEKEEGEGGEG